ncbi:MAG: alpha/beta hydrolase [Oceanicoccus sp.]
MTKKLFLNAVFIDDNRGLMMIVKIVKWFSLGAVGLFLLLVGVLLIGSKASLDNNYSYTRQVETLAVFSGQAMDSATTGLVRIAANGYEFRARIAGFESTPAAAEKPAVILLHGFPVSSAMWVKLIKPLAEAGYRVVAFDQRGYSPGARPPELTDYTIDKLSSDVAAIADVLGLETFHLVGHDWGSAVGWNTVMQYPQRIESWTALSIAHPTAFSEALENDPDQQSRSSYFALFVMPWLPEVLFSFNDFQMLGGAYSEMLAEQKAEYIALFSEPGALTSALNWYRAMTISQQGAAQRPPEISTPTLFMWGDHDPTAGRLAVDMQQQYMTGPYRKVELDAGHWLMTDQPDAVVGEIIRHIETYSQ